MKYILKVVIALSLAGFLYADAGTAAPAGEEKKTESPTGDLTDVQKIVEKANYVAYYQGNDGSARVNMMITDKEGRQRKREFNILRKDVSDAGDQMYYVYFLEPADVRKMVFMVHKHVAGNQDDDRWLYLPSLDLVKRIAASDKRTSFVGSDYLYEDVSGRNLNEDVHKLVGTDEKYYIVENTPIKPDTVEFSRFIVKIDKKDLMPMKMEFFDRQDRLYREIEVLEVKEIQGHPTAVKSVVKDHNSGSTTEMVFSNVKYDIGLGDIFTERYLRRPPREAR